MAMIRKGSVELGERRLPVLFQVLALLASLAFAAPASADRSIDPYSIGIIIIDLQPDPDDVDPYSIGIIIIDLKPTNAIIPVADEMRVFDTEQDYFDWLRSTFHFRNRDGDTWEAKFVVRGQGYAYDSNLSALVPVSDPLATIIGGRTGQVEIGGKSICVNAERCSNAVDAFTLTQPSVQSSIDRPFDDGARHSTISYERTALTEYDPVMGAREHARAVSNTRQVSDAFEIVSYTSTAPANLVCDALMPALEESNCYWVPADGKATIEVSGSNELVAGLVRHGKVEDVHGHCYNVIAPASEAVSSDLPGISVRVESYGWEKDTSPNRFSTRPNSLSSLHRGKDEAGEGEGKELQLPTDISPDC